MSAPAVAERPLIVELLLKANVLTPEGLRELQGHEVNERALVAAELATGDQIAAAYAEYLSVPVYAAPEELPPPDAELGRLLTEKLCREQLLAPIESRAGVIDVAFATPGGLLAVDELQILTGLRVRPLIAPIAVVDALIARLFQAARASFNRQSEEFEAAEDEAGDDEEEAGFLDLDQAPPPGQDGRVIRMVNEIFDHSIRVRASDIHMEAFEDSCQIRMRVDGKLVLFQSLSRPVYVTLISRMKILGRMDIAEKRIPQDGAIALRKGDLRIDLRVSTMPTVYGEKMVLRLLDKTAIPKDLTGLGLQQRQADDMMEAIHKPHGLMLVTGPTGSGKSTTLYTCLNLLNEPTTNICTVEDPVEYKFRGINQVQTKAQIDLTFARALRAFLRQDPDVIMLGEIRDQETASICMRAALTGHFVLSTIHTNDALSSINRLQDMGIEPFMIASTVCLLQAQRLVRRLCPMCKVPYEVDPETARRFGLEAGQVLYKPVGCENCRGNGYRGRTGAFEVIKITQQLVNMIQARRPVADLRAAVKADGVWSLLDSAVHQAKLGNTSLEAALAVAMAGEE